jgi:hypothetical protein
MHMARRCAEYFGHVRASDVHPTAPRSRRLHPDAAGRRRNRSVDWVVTNPPFKLALEFIRGDRAARGAASRCWCAAPSWKAPTASQLWSAFPAGLCAAVRRTGRDAGRAPGPAGEVDPFAEKEGTKASTATAYVWLVWLAGQFDTRKRWIAPCRQRLERPGDYPDYAGRTASAGARRAVRMTATKVSWQAFGNPAQMSMMQHGRRAVMQSTFDKAQAWLATPAADAAPPFTGAQLAAEIDVFLARTGMAQSRFGHLALNSPNALPRMRVQPLVRAETIARVRAFIANPPADALQQPRCRHKPKPAPRPTAAAATPPPPPQPPARVTREPAPRRDPTQRPPSLDAAESRRAGTMRHIAAIARSKEKVATDLVDAGADPTRQSTYVANQMREIIRRRAEEARQADPIEQAKLALRRRGRIVCDASVDGGRHGRFFVSGQVDDSGKRKQLDAAELTALAWKINPRGMEHLTGGAQR